MDLTAYRDTTYDFDKDFNKTISWSDGLNEKSRFVPNLPRAVRRINSTDDVGRYKRYFSLARRNQGKFFTWRHYLKILGDDLRLFDTNVIMCKELLKNMISPANSELSTYLTASDSETPKKKTPGKSKFKKLSFKRKKITSDVGSISSMDDISVSSTTSSLTPQTNLLKKMCTEIRTLAHKTCKTVEKISSKSKYCSACGDYIGHMKIHKDCSITSLGLTKPDKPLPPNMIKTTTTVKSTSVVYGSPMKTPPGGGENLADQLSKKLTFAPSAVRRMKPFTNQSLKKMED